MSKLAKLWSQVSRGSNNFQILEIQKRLHMMEEIMITNPKKKRKKVIMQRNQDEGPIETQMMGTMIHLIKFDLFLIKYNKIILIN
jgi:hypothetical protein